MRADRRQFIQETTATSRMFAVANPRRWLIVAAYLIVGGGVVGGAGGAFYASGGSEPVSAAIIALGAGAGLGGLALLPAGLWSGRHRQQARLVSRHRADVRDRAIRRHPVGYFVSVVVFVAVYVPLRLVEHNRLNHQHHFAVGTLLFIGIGAGVVGGILAAFMVARAKRKGREAGVTQSEPSTEGSGAAISTTSH